MTIRVLYFAALREAVGRAEETLDLPDHVRTVGELRAWLTARGGNWCALGPDRAVRAALAHDMVRGDAALADGAEVAFFPPVTGG